MPLTERDLLPLADNDLVPLFVPGTIQLPWPFPAVGEVAIHHEGAQFGRGERPGALMIVCRRVPPRFNVCWSIRLENVSAFLWTKGDELDEAKAEWILPPSLPKLESLTCERFPKGIVYVPEHAPVLMRVEIGETASGSIDRLSGWVGDCDVCVCPTFTSASITGGAHRR